MQQSGVFYGLLMICVWLQLPEQRGAVKVPPSVHKNVAIGTVKNKPQVLDYRNSFGVILKDLKSNWQSPIVYLRSRGYLPKDMASQMVAAGRAHEARQEVMSVGKNTSKRRKAQQLQKEAAHIFQDNGELQQRWQRAAANETGLFGNIRDMFRQFFASKEETDASEIQSQLGASLNLNEIKRNAKKEARKYYDEVLQKLMQNTEVQKERESERERERTNEGIENQKNLMMPLQKPDFLKWDLEHKTLLVNQKQKKEDYLNALVKIFAKKGAAKAAVDVMHMQESDQKAFHKNVNGNGRNGEIV